MDIFDYESDYQRDNFEDEKEETPTEEKIISTKEAMAILKEDLKQYSYDKKVEQVISVVLWIVLLSFIILIFALIALFIVNYKEKNNSYISACKK